MPGTTFTLDGELVVPVADEPLSDDPDPAVAWFFEPPLLHAATSSTAMSSMGTGTRRTENGLMIDRRG
jgi:hypothetical protein